MDFVELLQTELARRKDSNPRYSLRDVEDAIRRATGAATVIVPRSPLPDGDVIAILRDPSGLPFGVVSRGL